MKEEKELMARCGKEQPFKVPEGYFEQFHEQLMSSLPETSTAPAPATEVTLLARVKPWLYMAATFVGIIFMVQALMYVQERRFPTSHTASTGTAPQGANHIEELYAEEADHFMSSSLYDEYTLYAYLTNYENN